VEVIRHDALSNHPEAVQAFPGPHELDELVLLRRAEDKLAIHDARDAVIVGDGKAARCFEARTALGMNERKVASVFFAKGQAFLCKL
jgi:hypothetical protein